MNKNSFKTQSDLGTIHITWTPRNYHDELVSAGTTVWKVNYRRIYLYLQYSLKLDTCHAQRLNLPVEYNADSLPCTRQDALIHSTYAYTTIIENVVYHTSPRPGMNTFTLSSAPSHKSSVIAAHLLRKYSVLFAYMATPSVRHPNFTISQEAVTAPDVHTCEITILKAIAIACVSGSLFGYTRNIHWEGKDQKEDHRRVTMHEFDDKPSVWWRI